MKKLFTLLLSVILVFTFFPKNEIKAAQSFNDVPTTDSFYNEIMDMAALGIIKGYPNNLFRPTQSIQRGQVAVMLDRAIELKPIRNSNSFTDVPTNYMYSKEIQALYRAGVVDGYNGNFNPSSSLTRGQMAKMLVNAFNLQPRKSTSFSDVSENNIFNEYIGALEAANITTGYPDGTFGPNKPLSRVHFAIFMHRTMTYKNPNAFNAQKIEAHFIDVGQGDSILLKSPSGKTMLIDAGTKAAGDDVVNYLQNQHINRLDYVVATHPDADHIGGLIDVLQTFPVGQFINSGKMHTSATYAELLSLIQQKQIAYKEPTKGETIFSDGDLLVKVLYANSQAEETNDASLVLSAVYRDISFLLMGDADADIEQQLVAQYDVSTTILKAGHHGSSTSSSQTFLAEAKPRATILSYGADNSYGHPNATVLNNLANVQSKVFSTALSGSIVVTTNGYTFTVSANEMKNPLAPAPTTPSKPIDTSSGLYVNPSAPKSFDNCTNMRVYYPNGVKKGHVAYATKHDRDNDGWACEK